MVPGGLPPPPPFFRAGPRSRTRTRIRGRPRSRIPARSRTPGPAPEPDPDPGAGPGPVLKKWFDRKKSFFKHWMRQQMRPRRGRRQEPATFCIVCFCRRPPLFLYLDKESLLKIPPGFFFFPAVATRRRRWCVLSTTWLFFLIFYS